VKVSLAFRFGWSEQDILCSSVPFIELVIREMNEEAKEIKRQKSKLKIK